VVFELLLGLVTCRVRRRGRGRFGIRGTVREVEVEVELELEFELEMRVCLGTHENKIAFFMCFHTSKIVQNAFHVKINSDVSNF
jgi:hypothetical protein